MNNKEEDMNMSEENKDLTPLEVSGGKRKKGLLLGLAAGVLILIAAIFIILSMPDTVNARKVQEQLKLGAKYLSELNYEQAIVAYQAAIEIEPKCADAYLGLAEIYMELGEFAKAEIILEEAKKHIEDEEEIKKIEEKKKEVEQEKKAAEPTATPTPKPTATLTPEPTPTPTPAADLKSIQEISKASVGDYVIFGSYEQDNDKTNGAEVIEWQVLDKKDGKVLILSKYGLDAKPYHEEWDGITWESCTLRSWLNEDFYNTAFNDEEQKYIAETYLINEANPVYGTDGGNNTYDKVFLLSYGEVMAYFDSGLNVGKLEKRTQETEYAKEQVEYSNIENRYVGGGWWLRTPGCFRSDSLIVGYDGNIGDSGGYVYDLDVMVRPALWIDIEA